MKEFSTCDHVLCGLKIKVRSPIGLIPEAQLRGLSLSVDCLIITSFNLSFSLHYHVQMSIKINFSLSEWPLTEPSIVITERDVIVHVAFS